MCQVRLGSRPALKAQTVPPGPAPPTTRQMHAAMLNSAQRRQTPPSPAKPYPRPRCRPTARAAPAASSRWARPERRSLGRTPAASSFWRRRPPPA